MNYKRNLMTGLIGLALLAAPITAAARDNDRGQNDSHPAQAQSHNESASHQHDNAPARNESRDRGGARAENRSAPMAATHNESRDRGGARTETRNVAPESASRNESRDQRGGHGWTAEPAVVEHRDSREVRGDSREGRGESREGRDDGNRWDRDRGHDRDYQYWGHRSDDDDYAEGAPYYAMPYGYSGGACAWARHLRNVIYYDRSTGHPAAAQDLLPALRRAEQRCGGVPYGYGYYR